MKNTTPVFKGRAYDEVQQSPYINIAFRRQPAQYEDVQEKDWHQ